MTNVHDSIQTAVDAVRVRPATRRGFLAATAAIGGAAMALNVPALTSFRAAAQDVGDDEISVLNYALTLEHLENAFYRDGLASFTTADFEALGFLSGVYDYLTEVGAHEAAHVETLSGVISDLGGTPVDEGTYDFGEAFSDAATFLATGQALENTGVDAYTGAAQYLIDADDLLTAALTIHGVEARHAAYLNILNAGDPFPDAFDAPLTPAEVVDIAGGFIVDAEVVTPAAFEADEDDEDDSGTPTT